MFLVSLCAVLILNLSWCTYVRAFHHTFEVVCGTVLDICVRNMENIWNQKNLTPPPIFTFKCQRTGGQSDLLATCKNLENSMKIKENIQVEATVLSRMIYKSNNKLRFDKGFQNVKKVNRCIQRYLNMKPVEVVQFFSSCLPYELSNSYMPSRQMLQYLLVRLMGLSRLLHQTVLFCKTAGRYFVQRISLGQSWNIATILLGITSRIWTVCKSQVELICKSYKELLVFLPHLSATQVSWLPTTFSFPQDLALWLGLENSETQIKFTEKTLISDKIFSLLTVEDDEEDSVMLQGDSALPSKHSHKIPKPNAPPVPVQIKSVPMCVPQEEDLGESIHPAVDIDTAFEDLEKLTSSKQIMIGKISNIKSFEDLIKFMKKDLPHSQHHNAIRKQLKPIIKNLKKREKMNKFNKQSLVIIQKAKDILKEGI